MDIQLIVSDLDRTLLRTDKTLSAYTLDVLNRCRGLGIKLAFATARPKRGVERYLAQIMPDALIVHNGAGVYVGGDISPAAGVYMNGYISPAAEVPINGDALPVATIPVALRDAVLATLVRKFPESAISVEVNDTNYANSRLFELHPEWHTAASVADWGQSTLTDFTDLPDAPADKIIIDMETPEDIKRIEPYIPPELYVEFSSGATSLGLIMHRSATKWAGVLAVARALGVPVENIAAFGDDYNDVEMLAKSGAGVAVANGIDEAKAAAKYVCDTNDNDGPARWLEGYIL
jgi:hypothetical protein